MANLATSSVTYIPTLQQRHSLDVYVLIFLASTSRVLGSTPERILGSTPKMIGASVPCLHRLRLAYGRKLQNILVQLLFLVGLDSAVAFRVCNAGEHETGLLLLIVKERLVALVDLTGLHSTYADNLQH